MLKVCETVFAVVWDTLYRPARTADNRTYAYSVGVDEATQVLQKSPLYARPGFVHTVWLDYSAYKLEKEPYL